MVGYIHSIQDLIRASYGVPGGFGILNKADAPLLTSTTGVFNAIYGAKAWQQLNLEANAFALMPKYPWLKSGWRALTARASDSVTGGEAEDMSTLPYSIKPTFAELSTKPKAVVITFEVGDIMEKLALDSSDDIAGNMAIMRNYMAMEYREHVNKMLLTDNDTLPGSNMISIDQIVGSNSEIAGCGQTANDLDIYSQNRDGGATWTDAIVSHNSGTDRSLTESLLIDEKTNVEEAGGKSTFWLTGYDTKAKILKLYDAAVRYNFIGEKPTNIGLNGVTTDTGFGVGMNITTLYEKPLFISKNVPKDTISRMYLLDTSTDEVTGEPRLGIKVLMPPAYFEAGMRKGDPFSIDKISNKGMFAMYAETIAGFFKAQGKIRDLKA